MVLVPSRAYAALLKQRLLSAGVGQAAVRFWILGDARAGLLAQGERSCEIAVREHLHLLLSVIASQSGDAPTTRAIARDPSRLLRTLDQLSASSARGLRESIATCRALPAEATRIALAFLDRLDQLGWATVQQVDWQLALASLPDQFASVLIVGFDGIHWEAWPLLHGVARASARTTIVLNQPRYKAEQIDQIWIGSWEQAFGAATLLEGEASERPFAALSEQMENPESGAATDAPHVDVLIGRSLREQADAVVARCAAWLAQGNVTRLGILVPGPGPLCREVSARLLEHGIVHYDSTGHGAPDEDASIQWQSWLTLQREQKLGALLDFLYAEPGPDGFERSLDTAYGETLSDDLAVLSAWLADAPDARHQAAAVALGAIQLLPASATLGTFLDATLAECSKQAGSSILTVVVAQAAAVAPLRAERLPRSAFLEWLGDVTATTLTTRDSRASDPYAMVQLLPHAVAEGQPWSHLVLAGLNEGQWPPSFDLPGFLKERDILALNAEALARGDQGEGHLTVKPGRLIVLGPAERRALARREFYNLVESPTIALAVSAAMEDDEDGRALGPGDFLSHLFFTRFAEPLTEARAALQQECTVRWLETMREKPPEADVDLEPTKRAYAARRSAEPFGHYEFACAEHPPVPLTIPCKEWEAALSAPAAVWLTRVLGVQPVQDPLADERWPLTAGTWVHAWLSDAMAAKAGDRLTRRPDGKRLVARTRERALQTREAVGNAFKRQGRPLPDRWLSGWARACWMTSAMAERVGAIEGWSWAATEWTLPKPTEVKLAEATILRLRGRMDLVLAQDESFRPGARLWLFDFKTGSDKPLKPKDLLKKFSRGEGGLQLALYALGLRAIGAAEVAITLLTPATEATPQLVLGDVEALADFWAELARMQDTGQFGMRGVLRPEFGHAPDMPLATLAVPPDLLEEKWVRTHPGLAAHEE